jgi:hypothetical protein
MDMNNPGSHVGGLVPRGGGLHPPPEVMFSWPKPNYVDPEERGWEAPVVLIIFMAITLLVYIARMWARLAISKNAGLDDILISISMLPLLGLTITTVLGKSHASILYCLLTSKGIRVYGYQWHTWDQTAKTLVSTREVCYRALHFSFCAD